MRLLTISLLLVLGLMTLGADTPKTCSGRVVDFNSPRNHPIGLDAVEVAAYDPERKKLLAEVVETDGEGNYKLVGVGPGDDVLIEHSKEYYLNAPEKFKGVIPNGTLIVKMSQKSKEMAFYGEMGRRIAGEIMGSVAYAQALEVDWSAFRGFDYSLEERSIVKDQIAKELGDYTLIYTIDARITGLKLRDEDPKTAAEIARKEGIFSDIYFDYDEATITTEMEKSLKTTAALIKEVPFTVVIEGYADWKGTNEYNLALSEKRAVAVENWFNKNGVDQGKIKVLAYGEERPVCTSTDEECEARNRRISYDFSPSPHMY